TLLIWAALVKLSVSARSQKTLRLSICIRTMNIKFASCSQTDFDPAASRLNSSQSRHDGTSKKAPGNNSPTENSLMDRTARLSATQIVALNAYSASNWRHAPQGIGPPGTRATIARATKFVLPPVKALKSATLSAQQVRP